MSGKLVAHEIFYSAYFIPWILHGVELRLLAWDDDDDEDDDDDDVDNAVASFNNQIIYISIYFLLLSKLSHQFKIRQSLIDFFWHNIAILKDM